MVERAKRRLAAIVAADVAGYSRLIGGDEEGTLRALRAHRAELIGPLLDQHGGRIANTAGDSLLLEFSSAVEAVRYTVAMQDGMVARNRDVDDNRCIRFRVGIHVGDVIAEGGDLLGDGVNVAARLEALSAPGGAVLSDDAYRQVRDRLDLIWQDDGEHEVKNIARPIRIWRWSPVGHAPKSTAQVESLPDKPSIAVLPFDNMSGSPDFFSEGLAEDVVTALSKFRWLRVISPRSSFKFRTLDERDLARVGSELKVRYLLDGSIRRSGPRLRVVSRLTDVQMASTEWSEKFDFAEGDIFEMQDELTQRIVSSVAPASLSSEMKRAQLHQRGHPDTWIAVMRAHSHLRRLKQADNAVAQSILMQVFNSQPDVAILASDLAISHVYDVLFGWSDSGEESTALADKFARQAILIDTSDALAYTALGFAAHINRAHHDSVNAFTKALSLNENLAEAHGYFGMTLGFVGDIKQVRHHVDIALQLSPYDPMLAFWYDSVAMAAYMARDFELAFDWASRSVSTNPEYIGGLRVLAAACGQLNRTEIARATVAKMCMLHPTLTCEATSQQLPFRSPVDAEFYVEGLRSAGLP